MSFNPNDNLIDLKGKKYLQVMWRLVWFREEHADWSIETLLVERTEDSALFRCEIHDNAGRVLSVGHGSETRKDFPDFLEKAETKAVGRALAMLGYGTQFAPEFDEGERIVDSPVKQKEKAPEKPKEKAPAKPEQKPEQKTAEPVVVEKRGLYRCMNCNKDITETPFKNVIYSVSEIVKLSRDNYGKTLCLDCCIKENNKKK